MAISELEQTESLRVSDLEKKLLFPGADDFLLLLPYNLKVSRKQGIDSTRENELLSKKELSYNTFDSEKLKG